MKEGYRNIYQLARKNTNLTQEKAAEVIGCSVRSVADYESGRTVPADDIVCRMIEIYNAGWLGYRHLKESTEIGRKYLPELDLSDLPKSVLRLQKEIGDMNRINSDMIEIACDGVVDKHEEPRWQNVTKEILEMAGAALAVVFSK